MTVPTDNNVEKNNAMRALGAEIVEAGHDFTAAFDHATALAGERGLHMVPSFDPLLVEGVASYGLELMRAVPDQRALDIILAGAERVVSVSEDDIIGAMGHFFSDTHNIAEGAGAAQLAALLKERERMRGKKVALVLSGGNLDRALYLKALTSG